MDKTKKMPVSLADDTSREAEALPPIMKITPSVYHECQKTQEELSQRPSYYAVLPAKVRYDEQLRPNAKLLYAEITALANDKGYCFASNAYLAELFGISLRTAQQLIAQLEHRRYVSIAVLRDETQKVVERRIYVDAPKVDADPHEKNFVTPRKKSRDPHEKNCMCNITSNNTIPPIVPQGGRRRTTKKVAEWKPERFEKFWKFYPRGENKQGAIRAWDRLQPSDELIAEMGCALKKQMTTDAWKRGIGVPYASTWLNNERWKDAILEPMAEEDGGSGWADDPEVI